MMISNYIYDDYNEHSKPHLQYYKQVFNSTQLRIIITDRGRHTTQHLTETQHHRADCEEELQTFYKLRGSGMENKYFYSSAIF